MDSFLFSKAEVLNKLKMQWTCILFMEVTLELRWLKLN